MTKARSEPVAMTTVDIMKDGEKVLAMSSRKVHGQSDAAIAAAMLTTYLLARHRGTAFEIAKNESRGVASSTVKGVHFLAVSA